MDMKEQTHRQARRQAAWAGVWMVVAIALLLARPATGNPKQWAVDQVLVLAGMLMLFQFGRMFQMFSHAKQAQIASVSEVSPSQSTVQEGKPIGEVSAQTWAAREVSAYASVDEAERNGWEFSEPVARFGGKPISRVASFLGRVYIYDGLITDTMLRALPQDRRVFGRLLYKLADPPVSLPPDAGSPIPAP